MKILIIFICLFFIFYLSATIINIPADQPTIQDGINVSVDGDTVLVHPGTYFESIDFIGKDIVVGSLILITGEESYISETIIDGNSENGRLVSFINGETENAKLIGITIRNGYGFYAEMYEPCGVGIYILNSSPSIENNIID